MVTHLKPHLDDVCAVWLFRRYQPEFKNARVEFVPYSKSRALEEETADRIFLGTGGGKFDEHKGDLEDCATSLVWKYLKQTGYAPSEDLEFQALAELVEWSRLIDLGEAPQSEFGEFSVQSFIRPREDTQEASLKAVEMGSWILDQILGRLRDKQQGMKDWQKHVEFSSRFGLSYAVQSEAIDRPFCRERGGKLFLIYSTERGVQFFTPGTDIDLEPLHKKLTETEPDADWYLHQSHHIILSGSSAASAEDRNRKTKLSFQQLVEVIKSV